MNLVELLKNALGNDQVINAASSLMGESTANTSNAISQAVPALLGGLLSKASNKDGAGALMNMLSQGNHTGGILNNVAGIFGGGDATNAMMRTGSSVLGNIFGDKMTGIIDLVSSTSGIKRESSANLMSLAAPVALGLLGKIKGEKNLDASGLMGLLSSQSGFLQAAAPAGLAGVLGLGSFDKLGGIATGAVGAMGGAADAAKGGIGKFLPWLLLALLGLGAWYFMKNCKGDKLGANVGIDSVSNAVDSSANAVLNAIDSNATAMIDSGKANISDAAGALGAFFTRKLGNGVELNIPANGIENQLIEFIENDAKAVDKTTWFNFDRINFQTGKSELTAESTEQVKNIAEILKAYPNVSLKIGGYTDNVGNAASNLKLSMNRANKVMATLVELGTDAKRLSAEGYGDQFPKADNGTAEGRSKNRRIAVRVATK